jgi:hypothetical protein
VGGRSREEEDFLATFNAKEVTIGDIINGAFISTLKLLQQL